MRVIGGAWSDETDACAGKAKRPTLVEAKADCVTERVNVTLKQPITYHKPFCFVNQAKLLPMFIHHVLYI